jgi:hypothetical protein
MYTSTTLNQFRSTCGKFFIPPHKNANFSDTSDNLWASFCLNAMEYGLSYMLTNQNQPMKPLLYSIAEKRNSHATNYGSSPEFGKPRFVPARTPMPADTEPYSHYFAIMRGNLSTLEQIAQDPSSKNPERTKHADVFDGHKRFGYDSEGDCLKIIQQLMQAKRKPPVNGTTYLELKDNSVIKQLSFSIDSIELTTLIYSSSLSLPCLTFSHTPPENIEPLFDQYIEPLYKKILADTMINKDDFADLNWYLAHAMPFIRGSASITQIFMCACMLYKNIIPLSYSEIMPDLDALTSTRKDFRENFKRRLVTYNGYSWCVLL